MAAIVFRNEERRQRVFKERLKLVDIRESEVFGRYRMSTNSIEHLIRVLGPRLEKLTNRSCAISVETQVLVGLRFLAKGGFLSEVADIHGVSRSSACTIITNFINAVNDVLDNIKFPDDNIHIKQGFFRRCNIPNIVGAIDGTLIPIIAPTVNEEIYICRKGFHAINVQAVCDSSRRFIDAVVRWPGSTHDSSMFDNCGLKAHMETNENVGYLLGDSGYPLRRCLLTPVNNPQTDAEHRYNHAQSSGRMVIEQAFGLLKSRFRCLHKTGGCLMTSPNKSCGVIMACMKLHNFCLDSREQEPDIDENYEDDQPEEVFVEGEGREMRENIIRMFEN